MTAQRVLNSPSSSKSGFSYSLPLSGLRVLVVDDEPDARELLTTLLGLYGIEVTSAANANDALQAFVEVRPNILLSDIGMPGEDGYSLIRRIRELGDSKGGQTPAVALTAYTRREDRTRAIGAGFDVHVAKPVEPGELLVVLATLSGRL
jgi:CheY-like chemotaxis protein